MSKTVWLVIITANLLFGFVSAINGDVAAVIFNCFLAYIAFQLTKDGDNNA